MYRKKKNNLKYIKMPLLLDPILVESQITEPSFPAGAAASTHPDPIIFYIFLLFFIGVGFFVLFGK